MYKIYGQSEHSQPYFISDTWLVDLHTFSSLVLEHIYNNPNSILPTFVDIFLVLCVR